ncbi:MAG TPA: SprT-like domain-containing protein [Candidatus Microsaccharimonas sp.]|nr:SprT-like domain-containing protein [Candidatus Microsaccharimonas sp.]
MAFKQFEVEGIGPVFVYKRAGVRSLRMTIRSDNTVRVTIPAWSPYTAGVKFAQSKVDWIAKHKGHDAAPLAHEQSIGKAHRLKLIPSVKVEKPASRVRGTEIVVRYPAKLGPEHASVQKMIQAASIRALRAEAEQLLPQRLKALAAQHKFTYGTVTVKNLKTRWGSCDQDKNITLNLYLMQLPWHLIDYVLLHELTHTRVMRHGPPFWAAMEQIESRAQAWRREIRAYKTVLG